MSHIRVLSENVSNRIAAGEVIARPASVVKELVENSIDAGANKITINIEQAGTKLISVIDNGCGMDQDDVMLCLEAHATSKIKTEKDIDAIVTFGFRGEALPSIASVARVTLRSRQKEDMEGSEVVVHGGKIISSSPTGCAPGSEIVIRDLFFNTPARKKFIKTQATEERHIQETVFMLSLPNCHITFELTMNGRTVYSSAAHNNLMPRLKAFLGKTSSEMMTPVSLCRNEIEITGFTAKHGFTKNTRREQRIFINGRPVDALPVYRGIRDAYQGLVEKGRFPPAVIFIKMPPGAVDVNVHPAKREVRFKNERLIGVLVSDAVRSAVQKSAIPTAIVEHDLPLNSLLDSAQVEYELKVPHSEFDFREHLSHADSRQKQLDEFVNDMIPVEETSELQIGDSELATAKYSTEKEKESLYFSEQVATDFAPSRTRVSGNAPAPIQQVKEPSSLEGAETKIMGCLDDTYILLKTESGLLVIDQHAAHERVLYEKILKASMEDSDIIAQRLLLPVTLEVSRPEMLFIENHSELFDMLGFDIEVFSETTVMINTLPPTVSENKAGQLLSDLLSSLIEDSSFKKKIDIDRLARAACTAAVKAHDKLSPEELVALIEQMKECKFPFSCPHGRPTVINISLKELEKRFGRR